MVGTHFGANAIPRSLTKKLAMSPSSTVHGGQHDTKYVTFELLLHAAFVADEFRDFMLEPARTSISDAADALPSVAMVQIGIRVSYRCGGV